MRDYIAWYLVELRHRLRGLESQQEVEDFVLETRNHLQESIDDMTSRGIAEDAAVKSAISDFGHPAIVARAAKGDRLSPKVYWLLIALIVILAVPALGQAVISANDDAMGWVQVRTFDYGFVTALLFIGVFLLALFSRKWCSIPIVCAGVAITGLFAVSFASKTKPYAVRDGASRFVLLSNAAAKGQVEARQKWLDDYDKTAPALQTSLAHVQTSGDIVTLIKQANWYVYPDKDTNGYRGWPYSGPAIPLVQDTPGPRMWIALEDYGEKRMQLRSTEDMGEALAGWRENGAAYLGYLKQERSRILLEQERFKVPAKIEQTAIAGRLIYTPMAIVLLYGAVAVLLNGFTILGLDLFASSRKRNWRRQLS